MELNYKCKTTMTLHTYTLPLFHFNNFSLFFQHYSARILKSFIVLLLNNIIGVYFLLRIFNFYMNIEILIINKKNYIIKFVIEYRGRKLT